MPRTATPSPLPLPDCPHTGEVDWMWMLPLKRQLHEQPSHRLLHKQPRQIAARRDAALVNWSKSGEEEITFMFVHVKKAHLNAHCVHVFLCAQRCETLGCASRFELSSCATFGFSGFWLTEFFFFWRRRSGSSAIRVANVACERRMGQLPQTIWLICFRFFVFGTMARFSRDTRAFCRKTRRRFERTHENFAFCCRFFVSCCRSCCRCRHADTVCAVVLSSCHRVAVFNTTAHRIQWKVCVCVLWTIRERVNGRERRGEGRWERENLGEHWRDTW